MVTRIGIEHPEKGCHATPLPRRAHLGLVRLSTLTGPEFDWDNSVPFSKDRILTTTTSSLGNWKLGGGVIFQSHECREGVKSCDWRKPPHRDTGLGISLSYLHIASGFSHYLTLPLLPG